MRAFVFIVFFLLFGAFFIISENSIKLNNQESIKEFFDEYNEWLVKLTDNTKTVSGYVLKMEWLPED